MKTKKGSKKSSSRKTKRRTVLSNHPVTGQVDKIRDFAHSTLASAGINNLALRSMEFGPNGTCPDGQHWEKVCTTDSSGAQTCTWQCVSN
jgi:hypothetical protein